MTNIETLAIYVAIFLLMNFVLLMRVGNQRMAKKVSLGDGGDSHLMARIRAHGNYVETIIFSLAALFTLALLDAAVWAIHVLGGLTLIGRLLHAHGMSAADHNGKGRGFGMMAFGLSMLFSIGYIIYAIATK